MGHRHSRPKGSKVVSTTSKQSNKEKQNQFLPYQPTEDASVDRLQLFHHVMRTIWDGNFCSPIDELLKKGILVLDLGCGPGTWSCDMAADYKKSKFIGVDLLPVFPSEKPFNVQFILSDATNPLPFPDSSFDFVYLRQMCIWLTERQYSSIVIPELIRVLKPNGWIEICEADVELERASLKSQELVKKVRDLLIRQGRNPNIVSKIESIISQMGNMSKVEHKVQRCPVGGWDARIGEIGKVLGVPLLLSLLSSNSLIPEKDICMMTETLNQEATLYKSYFNQHTFFAQKL